VLDPAVLSKIELVHTISCNVMSIHQNNMTELFCSRLAQPEAVRQSSISIMYILLLVSLHRSCYYCVQHQGGGGVIPSPGRRWLRHVSGSIPLRPVDSALPAIDLIVCIKSSRTLERILDCRV
jgi:hypothetical protein